MATDLPEIDFQRFWKRLQQTGLNAYEARSYLVLIGHPRFKALELAARAHVPRQKIYEVLDSLVEKGFAQVVQEKTKLFSAIEPGLAIPSYLARKAEALQQELAEQSRLATSLMDDLKQAYSEGQGGRGTLDFLRIVGEPGQIAAQYRQLLAEVESEYLEFARPPHAVDPAGERLVWAARERGVRCRLLLDENSTGGEQGERLKDLAARGVEIRCAAELPMKLALFDGRRGLIALLDPVITKPAWTSVVFDHQGFGQAMKGLFEDHWSRARQLPGGAAG